MESKDFGAMERAAELDEWMTAERVATSEEVRASAMTYVALNPYSSARKRKVAKI